ncbi:hypothetical protein, partial [Sulfitobacter sp. M23508]|uniref:hypothetical protein n=1 Tax=Sulfitobacter sp. M23508 TaxID=3368577 RepID=UPI003746E929
MIIDKKLRDVFSYRVAMRRKEALSSAEEPLDFVVFLVEDGVELGGSFSIGFGRDHGDAPCSQIISLIQT